MTIQRTLALLLAGVALICPFRHLATATLSAAETKPNIVFVMADDMGWGQTGYRGHPILKTPNLDAMAANDLRFERFYAAGPICSPTRASVLTGRSHDPTGVLSHGYALRLHEESIAQALQKAGYRTGHFGKWHVDGLRGPGAPILPSDPRCPNVFGFDRWVSVTNFFDLNPRMSRQGKIEKFQGDSSEIAVAEALKFIEDRTFEGPFFAVIRYGSPHSPFKATPQDKTAFASLDATSASHYGELVAMDRSLGTLRKRLRELNLAENTLLVFCSDNGGLPGITPETVGGLRGKKGTLFEGGVRVPGIVEWPAVIKKPRVTHYPACTTDLFPTVADILGLPANVMTAPVNGMSLKPLFTTDLTERTRPIAFRYQGKAALVDNRYKLLTEDLSRGRFQLYDLVADPKEAWDISGEQSEVAERMKKYLLAWNESVEASFAGKDCPEGKVVPPDPRPISWTTHPDYKPYLAEWQKRPEYRPTGTAPKKP